MTFEVRWKKAAKKVRRIFITQDCCITVFSWILQTRRRVWDA